MDAPTCINYKLKYTLMSFLLKLASHVFKQIIFNVNVTLNNTLELKLQSSALHVL